MPPLICWRFWEHLPKFLHPSQATNEEECGDIFADYGDVDDIAVDDVAVKNVVAEFDAAKDHFVSGENKIAKSQDELWAIMHCVVADSTKKTYADQMTNYMLWLN